MIIRYVNLTEYSGGTSNGFSVNSPMHYSGFISDLNNGEILSDDITYYLSGARTSWDFCGAGHEENNDLIWTIWKQSFYNTTPRNIYFKSYDGTPWSLANFIKNIQLNVLENGNINGVGHRIIFQNGVIQAPLGGIFIFHQQTNSWNVIDSNHIQSNDSILFPNSNNIIVKGSTLITQYMGFGANQSINIVNSILGIENLYSNQDSPKNISLDNVVMTENLETMFGYDKYIFNGPIQDEWSKPSLWTDIITGYNNKYDYLSAFPAKENFSYLTSAFNNITLSGTKNSVYSSEEPWDGRRDGVGFLYFDPLTYNVVKPVSLSGNVPWECELNFNNHLTSASKIEVNWRDGSAIETFTSGTSASHIYSNTGTYIIRINNFSNNSWYSHYDFCSSDLTVNVYDDVAVSAGLVFISPYDRSVVTEIYENTSLWLSAFGISGRVVTFEFETTKGSFINPFSGYNIDGFTDISTALFYDLNSNGTETATLHLNRGYPNYYSISLPLGILDITNPPPEQPPYVPPTYYVDLNKSTSGSGTSGNPYNKTEFYDRIIFMGGANIGDTYKLKGYANFSKPTSASRPYTIIDADYRKNITIDVWDALTYGPWMITIEDDYYTNNNILDFIGCTLKNGIIYNKPQKYGTNYYGGKFKFTNLYNMWIVNQGQNSDLTLVPTTTSGCNLYGNTIFVENNINIDTSLSTNDVNIYDNVINNINLNNTSGGFNNVNIYVYNNCFGNTSASFTGMNNVTLSENQFNWEYDGDWPFTITDRNYEQNLTWILSNKNDFLPFENISEPPNPGDGYDTYNLYEKGLFGFLRNLYYRS